MLCEFSRIQGGGLQNSALAVKQRSGKGRDLAKDSRNPGACLDIHSLLPSGLSAFLLPLYIDSCLGSTRGGGT